jgi:hypothetical protein
MFGRYRTGHEWQLMELTQAGLARQAGDLSEGEFLAAVTPRLTSPTLELDSTTSHHLYADFLRDRYPRAVFVHTIRDVASWTTSLLDMVLRQRIARARIGLPYSVWEEHYLSLVTEGTYDARPECIDDDHASLPPLMRYWAAHLRVMNEVLPPERTVRARTHELRTAAPQLATLVGVPVQTLRLDLSHANRNPLALDRFATFDSPALRDVYDEHCAEVMAELFPEAHERLFTTPVDNSAARRAQAQQMWAQHHDRTTEWVVQAIALHGPPILRK